MDMWYRPAVEMDNRIAWLRGLDGKNHKAVDSTLMNHARLLK
jgi:hypothetical protein